MSTLDADELRALELAFNGLSLVECHMRTVRRLADAGQVTATGRITSAGRRRLIAAHPHYAHLTPFRRGAGVVSFALSRSTSA